MHLLCKSFIYSIIPTTRHNSISHYIITSRNYANRSHRGRVCHSSSIPFSGIKRSEKSNASAMVVSYIRNCGELHNRRTMINSIYTKDETRRITKNTRYWHASRFIFLSLRSLTIRLTRCLWFLTPRFLCLF